MPRTDEAGSEESADGAEAHDRHLHGLPPLIRPLGAFI
jgi:hypothetical protein